MFWARFRLTPSVTNTQAVESGNAVFGNAFFRLTNRHRTLEGPSAEDVVFKREHAVRALQLPRDIYALRQVPFHRCARLAAAFC